jgi:hypothetical protein
MARGEVLVAYDAARAALDDEPDNLEARFIVALALARGGSTEHALDAAHELAARVRADGRASARLREDTDALLARLAKDRALAAPGEERNRLAAVAADLYEHAADRHGGSYSCVNAATLRLVAGDDAAARTLALRARRIVDSDTDANSYWHFATLAEAALVLGDERAAAVALARAAEVGATDLAARALTCRQLLLLCDLRNIAPAILDVLTPPTVLHYCGHRIDSADGIARFPAALESTVSDAVAEFLDNRRFGFAYGSLASGADILVAEAVLERDIELHVVLPFAADDFEQVSVAPAGPEWSRRYRTCLERAFTVICACDSAYLGDSELFGFAARIAMGHAINRATHLGVEAEQLAIWDGQQRDPVAGTGHDVEVWARSGRRGHVLNTPAPSAPIASTPKPPGTRSIRAILFSDLRGFSRLRDEDFPAFVERVLGPLAAALADYEQAIVYRNTWGDAITLVLDDVSVAAACALALQEVASTIDFARAGLPRDLALRVGGHVGPVLQITDPIRGQPASWGRELTRAARIEPRTPEGDVYVTDAFAALLALEPANDFVTEYVGRVTTAKQFETIPMYRLRRRTRSGD